jgi:hypothetical protein
MNLITMYRRAANMSMSIADAIAYDATASQPGTGAGERADHDLSQHDGFSTAITKAWRVAERLAASLRTYWGRHPDILIPDPSSQA